MNTAAGEFSMKRRNFSSLASARRRAACIATPMPTMSAKSTASTTIRYDWALASHGSSAKRNPAAATTATSAMTQRTPASAEKGQILDRCAGRCCRPFGYKTFSEDRALAQELALHGAHGDVARPAPCPRGEGGADARRLARGHHDGHYTVGRMCFVAAGNAAAGHDHPLGMLGQQAAQRDVVGLAGRQALQHRAGSFWVVDVDRVGAARDRIVELARAKDVVHVQAVFAHHAPRLAHPDLNPALHHVRSLESGDVAAQECLDLAHLAPAAPLGVAQVPDVGAENPGHARAVHADLVLVRRGEEEHVLARQVEIALL